MSKALEEGLQLELDFTKLHKVSATGQDVIPAIAQDIDTGEVVMMGYVNQAALEHSLKIKIATYWSTSRNELWVKGATSGEYLDLVGAYVNCEQNSILYKVRMRCVGACHTKNDRQQPRLSCYYREIQADGSLKNHNP